MVGSRYFKADGMTAGEKLADVWVIQEIVGLKDGVMCHDKIGGTFERGRKELNNLLQQGKIQII